VLGVAAAVRPVKVDPMLAHQDAIIMTLVAAALLPLLLPQWRLSQRAGLGLVIGYVAYLVFLAVRLSFF
jgi:Ca2+/Na+ antiporter